MERAVRDLSLGKQISRLRKTLNLARLRRKVWNAPAGSIVRWDGLAVRVTDGPNFYIQFKDVYRQCIIQRQRPNFGGILGVAAS